MCVYREDDDDRWLPEGRTIYIHASSPHYNTTTLQGIEEKAAAATGKSCDDLAAFWTRYNEALLSKLLLNGERDRLEEEHRLLQVKPAGIRDG